jgi:hypothetical protein
VTASGTQRVHRFHKQGGRSDQDNRQVAAPTAHLCCCKRDHTSELSTSLQTVDVFEVEAVGKVCFHSLEASLLEAVLDYTLLEAVGCSLESLTEHFCTVVASEKVLLTVVDYKTAVAVADAWSESADTESLTVVAADVEAGIGERLALEAAAVVAGVQNQVVLTAAAAAAAGTGAEAEVGVVDWLAVEGSDVQAAEVGIGVLAAKLEVDIEALAVTLVAWLVFGAVEDAEVEVADVLAAESSRQHFAAGSEAVIEVAVVEEPVVG